MCDMSKECSTFQLSKNFLVVVNPVLKRVAGQMLDGYLCAFVITKRQRKIFLHFHMQIRGDEVEEGLAVAVSL